MNLQLWDWSVVQEPTRWITLPSIVIQCGGLSDLLNPVITHCRTSQWCSHQYVIVFNTSGVHVPAESFSLLLIKYPAVSWRNIIHVNLGQGRSEEDSTFKKHPCRQPRKNPPCPACRRRFCLIWICSWTSKPQQHLTSALEMDQPLSTVQSQTWLSILMNSQHGKDLKQFIFKSFFEYCCQIFKC